MYRPAFTGSPPHRRGKARVQRQDGPGVGITPAQAGKRHTGRRCRGLGWDHPRAGGEKNKELEGVWLPMGSPPRGRGKVLYRVPEVVPVRITPAWAGKILADNLSIQGHKDHPRTGGEKAAVVALFAPK